MWDIIQNIFPYAIAYTIPILAAALGGLYSERSGVVNIGLEGLMIVGSFSGALLIHQLSPLLPEDLRWVALPVSIVTAVVVGALFSLLHAFASINLNANQVISGTAINMIAGALTIFLARNTTGSGNIQINGLGRGDVPLLSDFPVLGPLFFQQTYATTWIVLALLAIGWVVLYKTPFGLRLRACGEHPQAADSAGVNVYRLRYAGVAISGALAGLGGVVILLTYSGEFNGSVSGLGFLALAALIFGQWKPLGILGATFFFGFAATLANSSQVIPELKDIPGVILKIAPYVLTLVALVLFSKTSQAPRAAGEVFDKGKR